MNAFSRSRLLPALLLLTGVNAWSAGPVFNVLDYGARNDGSAPATEAIRSAIQAAKAAGGGTVYFPGGNYVTGSIALVSNLVLHIDAGATLRFPATRLPYTWGRIQGIECLTAVPLIGGRDLENVSITGLRISNVVASGMGGLKAYNTVGLELHNVQMNADVGPAFQVRDSTDLDLDGVSTRKPLPAMPVVRLDRCPGAIVRGSRAVAGTGTFLSVPQGELKSVALEGNALGSARQATEESVTNFW